MSNIVAIAFEGQYMAEGMLITFNEMQERGLLKMEDCVVVERSVDGELHLKQSKSVTGKYALGGRGIGLIVGSILGGPVGGMILGAAAGAIVGGNKDLGIEDKFIKDVAGVLRPETSAIFVMVSDVNGPAVLEELKRHEGLVLATNLTKEQEKRLTEALEK